MSKKTNEISINQNHLNFATTLANSAKMRLDENATDEEKEIDRFFNYCMSRLIWEIYCCSEPRESYYIKLKQSSSSDNSVVLQHGVKLSNYVSFAVTENKFYSVMQKVADIFNHESMENYRAICDTTRRHASLTIFLENFSK